MSDAYEVLKDEKTRKIYDRGKLCKKESSNSQVVKKQSRDIGNLEEKTMVPMEDMAEVQEVSEDSEQEILEVLILGDSILVEQETISEERKIVEKKTQEDSEDLTLEADRRQLILTILKLRFLTSRIWSALSKTEEVFMQSSFITDLALMIKKQ